MSQFRKLFRPLLPHLNYSLSPSQAHIPLRTTLRVPGLSLTRKLLSLNYSDVSNSPIPHSSSTQSYQGTQNKPITVKGEPENLPTPMDSSTQLPPNVLALYLRPTRHPAPYGIPACNLHIKAYHSRNMELFADFALRAAYYLQLSCRGPVPMPRKVETWTVPRSPFVHKKSQQSFRRITLHRVVQVLDANAAQVRLWLSYLHARAYHGIALKADIWDYDTIDISNDSNVSSASGSDDNVNPESGYLFDHEQFNTTVQAKIKEILQSLSSPTKSP